MNTYKDGKRVFGVETNFDYYLVENIKTNNNLTLINDIDNKKYKINLNNWDFIPNGNFNQFKKLLANNKEKKVKLLYDGCSYHTQKDWIKNDEDIVYKHKCIYTINSNSIPTFKYSKIKYIKDIKQIENKCLVKNIEHFGIPKVIWSNGAGEPIIDEEGKYGLSEFAYAIVDDKQNLQKIKDAMISEKFINLMKYSVFKKNDKYNYKIIGLLEKDFYNDFIL